MNRLLAFGIAVIGAAGATSFCVQAHGEGTRRDSAVVHIDLRTPQGGFTRVAFYGSDDSYLGTSQPPLADETVPPGAYRALVYVRGCELLPIRREALAAPLTLEAVQVPAAVSVRGTRARHAAVRILAGVGKRPDEPAIVDWMEQDVLPGEPWQISIPRGVEASVIDADSGKDAIVWPHLQAAHPGGHLTLIEELHRTVAVVRAHGGPPVEVLEGRAYLDYLEPPEWEPDHVDSLIRYLPPPPKCFGSIVGERELTVPGAAWHLYMLTAGGWVYSHLPAKGEELVLPEPVEGDQGKDLQVAVDGATPVEGAAILPGRLDLATALVGSAQFGKLRIPLRMELRDGHWVGEITGRYDRYTLVDPVLGIAHLVRDANAVDSEWRLRGAWCRGELRVTFRREAPVSGRICTWPTLRGSGKIFKGLVNSPLERVFNGGFIVTVPGLPPGPYDVEVREGNPEEVRSSAGGVRRRLEIGTERVVLEIK